MDANNKANSQAQTGKQKRQGDELLVAAIKNGTVIDHIPSVKLFQVIRLLKLDDVKSAIMVGYNRYKYAVLYLSVIVLVILVQVFQSLGTRLAIRCDKRLKH